ncbi:Serine/threonine-protein phosphatase 7 [Striga hermonthica]|uniref:Serine/threonine-protein phosphatase 7 n=1 Tax=Striga hermonthica TaxID=68872 RepID=A0A9N7N6U3_STRHE|nr:Serine/threonine-protein phosphatase 7 [Striga hermonthica]
MPHRVYLLHGNHESKYCTSVYGFEKEVYTKYGDNGKHVYRKCLGCFEGLPLASIIAGKVYTAHGGLFRGTIITPSKRSEKKNRKVVHNPEVTSLTLGNLEELGKARRSVVLDPPWEGPNLIPGDVLRSDPSMSPGLAPNKERGIGLLWGPDCTEAFLKKFNLKLIIRSHEGPDARDKRPDLGGMDLGYTIDHTVESGKLITLFSAPDYPQFQATEERYRNKGAYIVLEPPHFDTPIFHSFEAVTPRPKSSLYLVALTTTKWYQSARENPNGKGKEKKAGDGEDGEKVAAATDDFLIIYEGDAVNVACQETSWVIDSGASIHVTSQRDFFKSYTSGDFGSVRMGNDGISKAVGMGDVHLETENGNTLVLRGVKHVPNIRMNLISTGKLDDEGFCNTFRDEKWKLTKGSLIVARGQKYSSLYVMNVKIMDHMINAMDDERTVELWHNRLSHMSEKGLTVLAKKNLLPGVKTGFLNKCAHCLAGKQTRVAFKRVPHSRKTDNGGEYCGPFDEYCRQQGIRHKKTPPKTPQLNGLAERTNRTLVERIQSLYLLCILIKGERRRILMLVLQMVMSPQLMMLSQLMKLKKGFKNHQKNLF